MKKRLIYLCSIIGVAVGLSPAMAEEATSLLPLGRSWAGNENLPLPYGIGVDYYYQRQGYDIKSLSVNVPSFSPAMASAVQVKTRVNEGDGKLDAWLFPFLNVFVLGGYVAERTTVTGIPPPINTLVINEHGDIFGGGMTLVGSIQRLWGSVLIAETYADLNNSDSWIRSWVVCPKVGVQLDAPWREKGWNVWVGGMFQRTDEDHSGTLGVPGLGHLQYNVKLQEEEAWNALFGTSLDICKHWEASAEAGVGQRQQFTASLAYRF